MSRPGDVGRRLRAMLVVSLLWGVVWGVAFELMGFVGIMLKAGFREAGSTVAEAGFAPFVDFGTIGMIAGLGFSLALSLVERRRELGSLSALRVALWGAVGGTLVVVLKTPFSQLLLARTLTGILFTAVVGAVCASGTLMVARRGKADLSRLGSGDADAELGSGEASRSGTGALPR